MMRQQPQPECERCCDDGWPYETTEVFVACSYCHASATCGYVCITCGHSSIEEPSWWRDRHERAACLSQDGGKT